MSGFFLQRWMTYAEDDKQAKKCLALVRSLMRTLTTRPSGIIISSNVTLDMRLKLQEEFLEIFLIPTDNETAKDLAFRDVAKDCTDKKFPGSLFIDPNYFVVKNVDALFSQMENTGRSDFSWPEDYCHKVNLDSIHPSPLDGRDVRVACFTGPHPLEIQSNIPENQESLERLLVKLCESLCPEFYPQVENTPLPLDFEVPNNSIAIIGMSCRYPGANSITEFGDMLERGGEGLCKVPDGRWNEEPNIRSTEAGFLSCPVDTFDNKFFKITPAQAQIMDPQQRLSLKVVWEGLEDAGVDSLSLKGTRTGVFGGWSRNEYTDLLKTYSVDVDPFRAYLVNSLGSFTATISHFLEIIGPSKPTETACSSSGTSIHDAVTSLTNRECDLAIVICANLMLQPFRKADMGQLEGMISPDGRCKTFDESADGFGRAEGVGCLILRRYSDADAAGEQIWGLIRGTAVVQEGTSKSIGTPTVDVEVKAMRLALKRANVSPEEVQFVETHGTGTQVGDPIEVSAIASAYSTPRRNDALILGSVKTNIGHTEAASGIASVIKTLLAMKNESIPQHLHLKRLNPSVDLDSIPARLPLHSIPWPRRTDGTARLAGVSSFGITGSQSHIILQEAPSARTHSVLFEHIQEEDRILKILPFSAKSTKSLDAQLKAFASVFSQEAEIPLRDLEFTLQTARDHFPQLRHVVICSTKAQLLAKLREEVQPIQNPTGSQKICFLFPGQGSQYAEMGRILYKTNILFRSNMNWCDSVLKKNHEISNLIEAVTEVTGAALLETTRMSGISIFCMEFCLLRLWESWGVHPNAVLGHSLGEFAAAVAAEILSPEDALTLVVKRSELIQSLKEGSMIVVRKNVEDIIKDKGWSLEWLELDIAAVNSEEQTVLAGSTELIDEFNDHCQTNGIKSKLLKSQHAFHSRLLNPILPELMAAAKTITASTPKVTFISGLEGKAFLPNSSPLDADYWVRLTRDKVNFLDASRVAVKDYKLFLEIGTNDILSDLVFSNSEYTVKCLPSLQEKKGAWDTMLAALGEFYCLGGTINWESFQLYTGGKFYRSLPGYQFDESVQHWYKSRNDVASQFHPLLGYYLPTPSGEVITFTNKVSVERLNFLKDHRMRDRIIFPCVGFLDLCLTAGYTATRCPEGSYKKPLAPVSIKNFIILSPLALDSSSVTEFHVVVGKKGNNIAVHTRLYLEDGCYKWIKHAEAEFCSTAPPTVPTLVYIKSKCTIPTERFQQEDEDYGINLGSALRTLTSGTKCSSSSAFLFKFTSTNKDEDLEFFVHPWTVDAMLQAHVVAVALSKLPTDLGEKKNDEGKKIKALKDFLFLVPVSIDSCTWWGGCASDSGYIYTVPSENLIHMFNEEGKLMVSMLGTLFRETTHSSFLSVIDSQSNPLPQTAHVEWKAKEIVIGDKIASIPSQQNTWIVFGDEDKVSRELQERLNKENYEVTTVTISELRSHKDEEQMEAYLKGLFSAGRNIVGVVYLLGITQSITTEQITQTYLTLCKQLLKFEKPLRVIAFTMNIYEGGGTDFYSVLSQPASILLPMTNTLANEDDNQQLYCKVIDMDSEALSVTAAISEIFSSDVEGAVAYRDGLRFVRRLCPYKVNRKTELFMPKDSRFQLSIPSSRQISDLTFTPSDGHPIGGKQVEIEVKAYGLNLVDLSVITDASVSGCNLGLEVAGVVSICGSDCTTVKVNDRVLLVRHGTEDAMPSHVVSVESKLIHIPYNVTYEEAAAIALASITAQLSMCELVQVKQEEVVFIHGAASETIGLLVIEKAKTLNCIIVATVESKKQENFLRNVVGLNYVFNSRTPDYVNDVKKKLGGREVSVILNNVTDPDFLEPVLSLCKCRATFLAMRSSGDSEEEKVRNVRPDVTYIVMDISMLSDEKYLEMRAAVIRDRLQLPMNTLPVTVFHSSQIRQALEYMQKGEQVGKVVIKMSDNLFNTQSTYLITGGLGGIGLEVVKFMVTEGARSLLLLGRSKPKPDASKTIDDLTNKGVTVKVEQCDVGDYKKLKEIITKAGNEMLPIRGIMHAAGVLDDAKLVNQNWTKFENVSQPKIHGLWNLHRLSKKMPLEHFVAFSSVASLFCFKGQINYAAANHYMDSLIHHRALHALPATTINWGLWGQVGMGVGRVNPIIKQMSISQGLAALKNILREHTTQTVVWEGHQIATFKDHLPSTREFLGDLPDQTLEVKKIATDEIWKAWDACENDDAKFAVVLKFLKTIVQSVWDGGEEVTIGEDEDFREIGIDSHSITEIFNQILVTFEGKIQQLSEIGEQIKLRKDLKNLDTLSSLAKRLVQLLNPPQSAVDIIGK